MLFFLAGLAEPTVFKTLGAKESGTAGTLGRAAVTNRFATASAIRHALVAAKDITLSTAGRTGLAE
jgi:hypothetical protein